MHKLTIYPLLTHTRQKPIEVYAPNLFKLAHAVFKITHSAASTYKHLGYIKTVEETSEDVIIQAHKDGKVIDIMRIHTTEVPSEDAPKGAVWS
jgi:dTDP-4-amino-4,6-dideoxygalactose transaminase